MRTTYHSAVLNFTSVYKLINMQDEVPPSYRARSGIAPSYLLTVTMYDSALNVSPPCFGPVSNLFFAVFDLSECPVIFRENLVDHSKMVFPIDFLL